MTGQVYFHLKMRLSRDIKLAVAEAILESVVFENKDMSIVMHCLPHIVSQNVSLDNAVM